MKVSVGKPVLAAMSVACIAVPAATGVASAATPASTISPVRLAAAAAAPVDPALALLNLVTFPIHNALGIAIGVGTAANAGLNLVLLPVSIASFIATNQTDKIPAYVQTVQTNLANAIPGIIKSIQAEVAYDQNLFANVGVTQAAQARPSAADVSAIAAAPLPGTAASESVDVADSQRRRHRDRGRHRRQRGAEPGAAPGDDRQLRRSEPDGRDPRPGAEGRDEPRQRDPRPSSSRSRPRSTTTKSVFSSLGIVAPKLPAMAALEAPQVKKIAAGTEADAPKALAAGDSSKDSTPTDSTPAKDGKPVKDRASDSRQGLKPSDTTPAKDSTPSDSTPAKDSTPDKDGKPGKTGVHHQGGAATGTNGAANGQNAGDAGKPSNSTPSKHTGAGKHRAAAGAR